MNLPRSADVIGVAHTRALLALLVVHRSQGHATVSEVSLAAGRRPKGSVYKQLRWLRTRGLVSWELGCNASLRPLVAPIAYGPSG